jgi:hypothetical protein
VVSLPPAFAPLVRTDFTDDAAWAQVVDECTRLSPEGFAASVQPVSDASLDGADWASLRDAAMLDDDRGSVLFVVDPTTLASADHPVLVVSTSGYHREQHPGLFEAMSPFRCVSSLLWSVENNLNLANLDWHDFSGHADATGVFRGF